MGNECCSRERMDEAKITIKEKYQKASEYSKVKYHKASEYSKDKYEKAKTTVKSKVEEAKITYAPQIKQAKMKYDEAKMRVKGYTLPKIQDASELNMITDFEHKLPLTKIDLDEFERRLKKLSDASHGEKGEIITEDQLIEVFKDHHTLEPISTSGTLVNQLLINKVFKHPSCNENEYYIPYLLLLGVLYCPSSPELKA